VTSNDDHRRRHKTAVIEIRQATLHKTLRVKPITRIQSRDFGIQSQMNITNGTRLGRYEIRSKIGEGGMGEVYLAHDTSELGRLVALKILPAEVAKDKDRLQRFTQEARTVSNLNHPNIVTVHEFGQTLFASFSDVK
jgi:hypothetical protein